MKTKVVIISAPSGTGKSTIIGRLLQQRPDFNLHFSVSATSRAPRGDEQHAVAYYFFSPEEFRTRIQRGEFIEYEEVYKDKFYGTLRSEVDDRLAQGENVIFDVDCVGALNIKRVFGHRALTLFLRPPSLEELRRRLEHRGTDSPELIAERLSKAEQELSRAPEFDYTVTNDDLERCYAEVEQRIQDFLSNN